MTGMVQNGNALYVALLLAAFVSTASCYLKCLSCQDGHEIHTCPTVTCQINELCHSGSVINHLLPVHTAGCMQASACRHLTELLMHYMEYESSSIFGKRDDLRRTVHMCDICCGDDLCNKQSCMTIKHKLFTMYTSGTLNMTSLSLLEPADPGTQGQ